ncbi:MOB kinase activator 2-like isoform X1 [Petromyzon marinus]|uniref:MOB kinase activator 2-like isoform X1 n=1 Tax=Petromyzon marinus TaxID=7757 RepID=UPI003F72ADA3
MIKPKLPLRSFGINMVFQSVTRALRKKTRPDKDKEKERRSCPEEHRAYLEGELARARITDTDFILLTALPPEIDRNEWLATHTTTFFNYINLQYSTISEFCTPDSCSTMCIGSMPVLWQDSDRGKKTKCTAPQYIDCVMSYVQKQVTDENTFPTKYGRDFPPLFEALVRRVFRLLFHVLAHLYCGHFRHAVQMDTHAHLNTLACHFLAFARAFTLLPPLDEMAPVGDLLDALASPPSHPPLLGSGPLSTTDDEDDDDDGGGGGGGGGDGGAGEGGGGERRGRSRGERRGEDGASAGAVGAAAVTSSPLVPPSTQQNHVSER